MHTRIGEWSQNYIEKKGNGRGNIVQYCDAARKMPLAEANEVINISHNLDVLDKLYKIGRILYVFAKR